jgi:hydroxylamine reductase (hybrid-cluster protein)
MILFCNLCEETARGCAKRRDTALDHGTVGGIMRVVDAGQCNDCYSLGAIAQRLADAFGSGSTTCRSRTTSPGTS